MNPFVLELWDDEGTKCTFYTVRWDGESINETDRFFTQFANREDYAVSARVLYQYVIRTIGERYGPDRFFNREENEVWGLPHKGLISIDSNDFGYFSFPLRLYAIKIGEGIVVLFGGGIKDASTNQKSSLNQKWREACRFANAIDRAIQEGMIEVCEQPRKLYAFDGTEAIFLP